MAYTEFHTPTTLQFMTPEVPPQPRSKNFVFVNNDESRVRKNKIQRSCNECRKRKIRCESATTERWPCSHCLKIGSECTRPTPFEQETYSTPNGHGVQGQQQQYMAPQYTFNTSPFPGSTFNGQIPVPLFPIGYGMPAQYYPAQANQFVAQHDIQHVPTFIAPMPAPPTTIDAPQAYLVQQPTHAQGYTPGPAEFQPPPNYAMTMQADPLAYQAFMLPGTYNEDKTSQPMEFTNEEMLPAWQYDTEPTQSASQENGDTPLMPFADQELDHTLQPVLRTSQVPSADNIDVQPGVLANQELGLTWQPDPHTSEPSLVDDNDTKQAHFDVQNMDGLWPHISDPSQPSAANNDDIQQDFFADQEDQPVEQPIPRPSQPSSADTGNTQPTQPPATPPAENSELQSEVEDQSVQIESTEGHEEDAPHLYGLNLESEELSKAFERLNIPGDNATAVYITQEQKSQEDVPTIDEPDYAYARSVGPGQVVRIDPEMMPSEIHASEYFAFYFEHIHPYLPVVNPPDFWRQWHGQRNKISPLLLAGMFACIGYLREDKLMGESWLNFGSRHQKYFEDGPRLSTLQAMILLLKAEEFNPKRGYHYRTWTTMSSIVRMGQDLQLNEHLGLHKTGMCLNDAEGECIVRARCWNITFMLELMIGGAQGRKIWGVPVDTVDVDNEVIFQSQNEHEREITENFSYFLRSIRTVRKLNHDWQELAKANRYWARQPEWIANNANVDAWLLGLPERHRIDFPADDSPPPIRTHFSAMLHVYHYLSVMLQHRPQLTHLKQTDPNWAREVGECYLAAKRICVLQEAVKNKYGLSGLWLMLRGAHFHLYTIITCNMIHVVAALFPPPYGPQLFPNARDFANRHMRILHDAMNSMPLSFMANKIDPLFSYLSKDKGAQFVIRDDIQPIKGSEGPESPLTELPNAVTAAMGSLAHEDHSADASVEQVSQIAEVSMEKTVAPPATWQVANEATDSTSGHDDPEDEFNLHHYERRMRRFNPIPFIETMSTIGGLYDNIDQVAPSSSVTPPAGRPYISVPMADASHSQPSDTGEELSLAAAGLPQTFFSEQPPPQDGAPAIERLADPIHLKLPPNTVLYDAAAEGAPPEYVPVDKGIAPYGSPLTIDKWGYLFEHMMLKRKLEESAAATVGPSEQPMQSEQPSKKAR